MAVDLHRTSLSSHLKRPCDNEAINEADGALNAHVRKWCKDGCEELASVMSGAENDLAGSVEDNECVMSACMGIA